MSKVYTCTVSIVVYTIHILITSDSFSARAQIDQTRPPGPGALFKKHKVCAESSTPTTLLARSRPYIALKQGDWYGLANAEGHFLEDHQK